MFPEIRSFTAFMRDDSGASAAEYAMILAIVGSGVAATAIFLGNAISASINETATCIAAAGIC